MSTATCAPCGHKGAGAIVLIALCVPEGDPEANEYGPVPTPAT